MSKKVLVVDDDEIISKIIVKFLKIINIETETAMNANECLEKIKKTDYDLYLIDLTLPDINGADLAKKLKEINPDSKIIIMSGYIESEIDSSYKEFYDDFIYKPELSTQIINKTKIILGL